MNVKCEDVTPFSPSMLLFDDPMKLTRQVHLNHPVTLEVYVLWFLTRQADLGVLAACAGVIAHIHTFGLVGFEVEDNPER